MSVEVMLVCIVVVECNKLRIRVWQLGFERKKYENVLNGVLDLI